MRTPLAAALLSLCAASSLPACEADDGDGDAVAPTPDAGPSGDVSDIDGPLGDGEGDATGWVDPPCDPARTPIVFAHGFLASSDTWSNHVRRFRANGWCPEALVLHDWNTLGDVDRVALLDARIDGALAATGASQVHLVGHSAGGSLGYSYLEDAERAGKVSRYAHVGSGLADGPAGPPAGPAVPTLNLWSPDDLVIGEKGDIPGATNAQVPGADHYDVATNAASFEALYAHFTDGETPTVVDPPAMVGEVEFSGRALTLGENAPLAGAEVVVWQQDADGLPVDPPLHTVGVASDGGFGPFDVPAGVPLWVELKPAEGQGPTVRHAIRPLEGPQQAFVLRGLPAGDSLVATLLGTLPIDDPGQTAAVIFCADQGLVHGRDSLTLDGVELASEELADPSLTTIAVFVYDDGDGESSGEVDPAFATFPFLAGVDTFLEPDPAQTFTVALNGRELKAPRVGDGVVILVVE